MKIPICYFDAKTKTLCHKCLEKLKKGEISELDIDLSHDLIEIEEKYVPSLKELTFHRALKVNNKIIFLLVTGSQDLKKSEWKNVIKRLMKLGYPQIKVIEITSTRDIKSIISQLISPARILSISISWYPDESYEYKVRIYRKDYRLIRIPTNVIEKAIFMITGRRIKLIFE